MHSWHGCNSFRFYIKPQHTLRVGAGLNVVIHFVSTSNHNKYSSPAAQIAVVIHFVSTSNHNGAKLLNISKML